MIMGLFECINYEHSIGENCSDCRYGHTNSYYPHGYCYKFHAEIPNAYSRICDCIGDLYLNYIFPDRDIKIMMEYQ